MVIGKFSEPPSFLSHSLSLVQVEVSFGTVDCTSSPDCHIVSVTSSAASTRSAIPAVQKRRKFFQFTNEKMVSFHQRCCFNSETRKVVSSQKHRKLMGVFSIVNHCRRCFRIRVQHSVLLHGPAACLLTLAYLHCRSTLLHQHRQPLPV